MYKIYACREQYTLTNETSDSNQVRMLCLRGLKPRGSLFPTNCAAVTCLRVPEAMMKYPVYLWNVQMGGFLAIHKFHNLCCVCPNMHFPCAVIKWMHLKKKKKKIEQILLFLINFKTAFWNQGCIIQWCNPMKPINVGCWDICFL